MGHIEATKILTAKPDAVWATISDPNTWDKWFTIHDRWMEEPPATMTEGAKLCAKIMMLGMANKIDWTVNTVQEPSLLELAGTGMAGVKSSFSFAIEPAGEGSKLTVSGDFDGALIKGALGKAVEKDGMKQLEKTLEQLDNLATAAK
jgi:carbon monoxide dehydrogenase subunit G